MTNEEKAKSDPLTESARLLKVRIKEFEDKKKTAPKHEHSVIEEAIKSLREQLTKTGRTLRNRYGPQ